MKINPVNNLNTNKNMFGSKHNTANLINEDRLVDTFLKVVKMNTQADKDLAETQTPSTQGQKEAAEFLYNKLIDIGLDDVEIDKNCFVTATLNSNIGIDKPVIGLFAHIDTSPEESGENVNPVIHNYTGGDIVLNNNVKISENDLKNYIGDRIITSDGTTLLGADDKAGIAEIIEAINILLENPDIKHPKIRIAFTPDEETGVGITKFDIEKFGADAAYTVDGSMPEEIENESFNAFNPKIIIKGKVTHCGYAKAGGMINSAKIAALLVSKFPKENCPEKTDGKEGYIHLSSISGNVGETTLNLLVRDHDYNKALEKLDFIEKIIKETKDEFGCEIIFEKRPMYRNMKEYIDKYPQVIEYAEEGIKRSGLLPKKTSIRGGTDGSELSKRGLPTPNLGSGAINFHSLKEFVSIEKMKKCTESIINILSVWGEKSVKTNNSNSK